MLEQTKFLFCIYLIHPIAYSIVIISLRQGQTENMNIFDIKVKCDPIKNDGGI